MTFWTFNARINMHKGRFQLFVKKTSTFAIHWLGMARAKNASDKHNESCHMDGYQTTDVAKW